MYMPGKSKPLSVFSCESRTACDAFSARHSQLLTRISKFENSLPQEESFHLDGWCIVCGMPSQFLADYGCSWTDPIGRRHRNWRERLECRRCGLNNRMRAAAQLLLDNFRLSPTHRVYLTEQLTPLFAALRARLPRLMGSEYLRDGTSRGAYNLDGVRHEDLTDLSFADASFDCIGCFEVLEHIPDFHRALAECARCLAPGGYLLLSTPIFLHYDRTLVRAVLQPTGSAQHLVAPEMHVDPLSRDGALCFYHFGWSLLGDLAALGFSEVRIALYLSRRYGYLGGWQPIAIARRRPKGMADW
jgi:SAM-dependent methyltransferase